MEIAHGMVLHEFDVSTTDELRIATQSLLSPSISFAYENNGNLHSDATKDSLIGAEIDTLWSNEVDSMFSNSKMFSDKKTETEEASSETNKDFSQRKEERGIEQQGSDNAASKMEVENSVATSRQSDGIVPFEKVKIKIEPDTESDCQSYGIRSSSADDQIVPDRNENASGLNLCEPENLLKNGREMFIKYNVPKVKEEIVSKAVCLQGDYSDMQPYEKEQVRNDEYDSDDDEDDDIDETEIRRSAPRNCQFVNYLFDSSARLPTFREAFLPILKKFRKRENEGANIKKRKDMFSLSSPHNSDRKRLRPNNEPVQSIHGLANNNFSTERDQTSEAKSSSSVSLTVLDEGNSQHDFAGLSNEEDSRNSFDHLEEKHTLTPQKSAALTISRQTTNKFSHENQFLQINLPAHDQCHGGLSVKSSHTINPITHSVTPVNQSINVDSMKNIFSFDEGLEMLEIEKGLFSPNGNISNGNSQTPKSESGILSWALGLGVSATDSHSANELVPSEMPDLTNEHRRYQMMPINSWEASNQVSQMPQASQMPQISPMQSVNVYSSITSSNSTATNYGAEHGQTRLENRDELGHTTKSNNVLNQIYPSSQIQVNNQNTMAYVSSTSQANHLFTMDPPSIANGRAIAQQIHESFGTDIFASRGNLTDNYSKFRRNYAQGQETSSENGNEIDISHTLNSFLYDAFSNPSTKFSNSHAASNQTSSIEFSDYANLDSLNFVADKY